MDISVRRIVITEDEDLDLDKLLLGDNSGGPSPVVIAPALASSPPQSTSFLTPSSPPTSPQSSQIDIGRPSSPPTSPILALEEEGETDEDEDDGYLGHWILPAPAQPGDFMNSSMHRVPSKSILKKVSSYNALAEDMSVSSSKSMSRSKHNMDCSSQSQASGSGSGHSRNNLSRIANNNNTQGLESSLSGGVGRRKKQASFLSLNSSSSSSKGAIGWDLDDSNSPKVSPPGTTSFLMCGQVMGKPLSLSSSPLPNMPSLKTVGFDASGADRAAGMMDSSGSRHSTASSAKIRRNVSFHSVNVREYDRTVGDNPSCRSGPPLSLDWSYSKKYEKNLEEYELERSEERVNHMRKLHMNKYKRRNLLAFHWGHSDDEMKEARKSTKKMQRQRSMTQLLLPISMAEEALVSFKSFLTKKKKSADSDDLSEMSNSASKKKKSGVDSDDLSEMSNSASTKDSSHTPKYSTSQSARFSGPCRGLNASIHSA